MAYATTIETKKRYKRVWFETHSHQKELQKCPCVPFILVGLTEITIYLCTMYSIYNNLHRPKRKLKFSLMSITYTNGVIIRKGSHTIKLSKRCNCRPFHPKLFNSFGTFKVFCYFNMIGQGVPHLWTLRTKSLVLNVT